MTTKTKIILSKAGKTINLLILAFFVGGGMFGVRLLVILDKYVKTEPVERELRNYFNSYRTITQSHNAGRRLELYENNILPVLNKYPNIIGVNNAEILDKHIPLLVIFPSRQNKFMGVVYGDYKLYEPSRNGMRVKLGRSSFFDWHESIPTNTGIYGSFVYMPKESLKKSILEMIASSKDDATE